LGGAVLVGELDHFAHRRGDSITGSAENKLLIFQMAHEPSRVNADDRFLVQQANERRDIEVVTLRKLPRAKLVITV
jgi:hypothetical protein